MAYLTGRCGVSQRDARELLATLYGVEVGLGSIAALEAQVSDAPAAPVAEAQAAVQAAAVVNADETSWAEQTRRCWLWTAVTALVTVFLLRPSRSSASAKELLGTAYAGIVGSDRYSGYAWIATAQRQVRAGPIWYATSTAVAERGGASTALGTACLDLADRLFARWYQVRDGTLDRATFTLLVGPLQAELHALLQTGSAISHAKTLVLVRAPAHAGTGPVDLCHRQRRRTDEQQRGARAAARRALAPPQLRHAERGRQPLRRAHPHRRDHAPPAGTGRARLSHRRYPGRDRRRASPLVAARRRRHPHQASPLPCRWPQSAAYPS